MGADRSVRKPQTEQTMNPRTGQQAHSVFGETERTGGGITHLIQFLWDKYAEHLQKELEERAALGKITVDLPTAKKKAPATHFATWAANYLKENRVAETFFVDANLGIRLTNNITLAVCPGVEVRGTMQESHAVQITEGLSNPENEGIVKDNDSLRI